MPRIVGSTSTHSALPDVSIDQHHARDHGPAQHSSGASILDKVIATTSISNSVAETDLYRKTIGAAAIGINGVIRLTLRGQYFNTSGVDATLRLKVKFGATTILDTTAISIPRPTANSHHWELDVLMWNTGVANSQRMAGRWLSSGQGETVNFHIAVTNAEGYLAVGDGTAAEDSTLAKDLAVTAQHGTAAGTITVDAREGVLELVT